MSPDVPVPIAPQADAVTGVYRKIGWRLLPFLLLCYTMSFLDRINIGFAKLQMQHELGISNTAYGIGAGIFFIGYIFFEVPSNLLLPRFGIRKTISRIMILWGLTSACMMFIRGETSFYVMRVLLGIFEAGFVPGVMYYLSFW
jgi:MFS family permease